jgi:dihydroflavonol-4-reductase
VTGGNGFIGSVVVRKLLESGWAVRCLLRPTSKTDRIDGLAYERAEGDVRDAAAVERASEGCAGIVHLACVSNWNDIDSPLMTDVVMGGMRSVIGAARKTGARLVHVSSAVTINGSDEPKIFDETATFTLDDRKLSYCRNKRQAEALALDGGVPVVICNPGEVYGPNDTALITAGNLVDFAKSSPVMVCNGGTSVVHVEDVADGIVRALDRGRPGERYILGGDNLTIRQLAELVLELVGRKSRIVAVPNAVIRGISAAASATHIPLPFNAKVIPYATRYWFLDNGKARRELGVTFRSARDTLAPTIAWLREAGHIK